MIGRYNHHYLVFRTLLDFSNSLLVFSNTVGFSLYSELIYQVGKICATQIRLRINRFQPHQAHQAAQPLGIDPMAASSRRSFSKRRRRGYGYTVRRFASSILNQTGRSVLPGNNRPTWKSPAGRTDDQMKTRFSSTEQLRFFLSHSNSTLSWPICRYSSDSRASRSLSAFCLLSEKRPGSSERRCFLHCRIWFGCTPYSLESR